MDTSFSALYRTDPIHIFPDLDIQEGHDVLAAKLLQLVRRSEDRKLIVVDGFVGIQWELFIAKLQAAFEVYDLSIRWLSTDVCFRPTAEIDALLEASLTQDAVFGRLFHGHLEDLWREDHVAALRNTLNVLSKKEADDNLITVVYGYGASCLAASGVQVYVDVPKDRGQQLAGQGAVRSVGAAEEPVAFSTMYKRFYFVDWPMLNRVKRAALPHLDLFVDATSSADPCFVSGEDFRYALHKLAQRPFRVKPWFAPGPWGGQWMKEQFGLPPDQPNYAWSFEVIAPENGVLLGDGTRSLECSFDYLLWAETDAVLGISVAARYGSYFPIRFDYLDTMGGTNLSCQVHPRVDYIRNEFGEPMTQDETYYIVANKPGARVFLGLRDDADVAHFRADAIAADDQAIPFDITTHVHSIASQPHDLFLIPSGTVHCSGADNLVLEISATPYIYTFKIYDYLRSDLSGNLRHVHLDHAFANLDSIRTASWVQNHLCPEPVLIRAGEGWQEYVIGENDRLFFAIYRLEFTQCINDNTLGKFHLLNLVEGEVCEVVTEGTEPMELRFAESMIIPASVGAYTLRNLGNMPCKVVKALVKG